jgi:uncharacterized phage protein (TIGR01671 family)
MREIKFRAWGIDGGVGPKMWSWAHIEECFDVWLRDSRATVEQFTGLIDKNGKEIYEGDIVKSWYADGGIVHYDCGQFFLVNPNHIFKYNPKWKYPSASMPICGTASRQNEVIGNVHENPELLIEKNQLG